VDVKDLIARGQLSDAAAQLSASLKSRPADSRLRVSLFEVLAMQGEWDRAQKQLEILSTAGDPQAEIGLQVYRDLLAAERHREAVFNGDALPKFYTEPPVYVGLFAALVKKLAAGDGDTAAALVDDAMTAMPSRTGKADGRPFQQLRDADDRTAGVFEVFHGGEYLWLPFAQVRRLTVAAPRRARDLVWMHATVETTTEEIGDAFLPRCYVFSSRGDEEVKAGRKTDFAVVKERLVTAVGPRVLLIDDQDIALADLRELTFDDPEDRQ
jgi:type VI secretion system protein ImpE